MLGKVGALCAHNLFAYCKATSETDTPEKDVNRNGTYYFAHVAYDGALRVYRSPELTLNDVMSVSTYEAWRYYSAIVGYDDIGFYTKSREDAEKLAVLLGGSISKPDEHFSSVGIIYPHFHDAEHEFHIWYGSPIFG